MHKAKLAGSMQNISSLTDRMTWLRRFRDGVKVHHRELVALVTAEIGKSGFEALAADVLPLIGSCNWHLRRGSRLLSPKRVGGGGIFGFGHRVERHRMPLGRVLVIATWNYPVQLLGIQLVQAVLAGNRVVVKPSERAPKTQARLIALAVEAAEAVPSMRGVIESRPATRGEGQRLVAEEPFDHVIFIGSTAVGRAIAEVCAARLIPTTLELSGSDSAIVFADADARAAARAVFMGFTANAGQTCMAPRRALVAREVAAAFTDEIARLLAAAPTVRLVDAEAARTVAGVAEAAVRAGGRNLHDSSVLPANSDERAIRPLAVVDCPVDTDLFRGRHFGPALAVHVFATVEEAFALHATVGQFLATSLWTRRPRTDLAARAHACGSSLVHFNAVLLPSAHPAIAITGSGASGWGSSRGETGLLALTREVCVTRSSTLVQPPAGEPSSMVQAILSRVAAWPKSPVDPPAAAPNSVHAPDSGDVASRTHPKSKSESTKVHA